MAVVTEQKNAEKHSCFLDSSIQLSRSPEQQPTIKVGVRRLFQVALDYSRGSSTALKCQKSS